MKPTVRFKALTAAGLVSGAAVASLLVTNASAVTTDTKEHAPTALISVYAAAPQTSPHDIASQAGHGPKPTVVLVHGAFADSSSWNSEIGYLRRHGYPVYAIDTPLRGLAFDSAYVEAQLKTIKGPVVLVGHSYAGEVVSQVAAKTSKVKALVYVAALIPKVGDTAGSLIGQFPGSQLVSENFRTVPLPGGDTDVYLKADKYGTVYGNGLSKSDIRTAAVTQEPVALSAFTDKATVNPPTKTPKWAVISTEDHAVPTAAQKFEAKRVGAHISYTRSGHDVPSISPGAVDRAIVAAANSVH
ncbi:alpha/beta fold hydrolase [Streptomyces sp. NPDC090493]|uniref:alpha/beta hydrolase n=1 Tax=Streptomyces sp. NPDC090493 TaxID=3365964 RepID=UPI0038029DFC